MDMRDSRRAHWSLRDRLGIISSRNMKRNREAMQELQNNIKVGAKIMFAGGIYGKIVKIKNDVIDVEVSKSSVISISRYSIQNVIRD